MLNKHCTYRAERQESHYNSISQKKESEMKKIFLFIIASALLITAQAQQLTLVKASKSNFKIIIPDNASVIEIQAAKVFQDYIQRISGAMLPIESDKANPTDNEVLIGNVNRVEKKETPVKQLEGDGIFIRNTDKKLIISGGTDMGVVYGVYTFLEKYLGCRKYSSAVTVVPKQKTITLNSINDTQVPDFAYRQIVYPDARDPEYMDWNKLDAQNGRPASGLVWGSFMHTFNSLLSTKEYGESHPEYFSFYDGKRHPGNTATGRPESQLCLTNPEVFEIVCKNLKALMDMNPGARYWSVSQNDNVNYCRCPECAALDAKYASFAPGTKLYGHLGSNNRYAPVGSGSVITFVNKVAERFPDKIISTAAYQYTRVPPKGLVPAKNVNIILCSIESPRNVTLEAGDPSFCEDLDGWSKLTNNILIWDYVVQYRNLISPFPNLHTLQPNLQYLHKKGIPFMFEEGNPESGGEFYELKAWLISKLYWDINLDFNAVMNDFLSGYYGAAGPIIREYIDLSQQKMIESGKELIIYGGPVEVKETYLSESLINTYNNIFDRAEKAVSKSPDLLERVRVARLPLNYAILEIARSEKTGQRGALTEAGNGKLVPKPEIVKKLYDFAYLCKKTNVSHVREGRITPDEYLESFNKFLKENTGN
jgi:hypothetical protein